jgi:hypothetical protein
VRDCWSLAQGGTGRTARRQAQWTTRPTTARPSAVRAPTSAVQPAWRHRAGREQRAIPAAGAASPTRPNSARERWTTLYFSMELTAVPGKLVRRVAQATQRCPLSAGLSRLCRLSAGLKPRVRPPTDMRIALRAPYAVRMLVIPVDAFPLRARVPPAPPPEAFAPTHRAPRTPNVGGRGRLTR